MNERTVKNIYAKFITKLLQQRKISANKFCVTHGIPQSTLASIMARKNKTLLLSTLDHIADSFGFNVNEFHYAANVYNKSGELPPVYEESLVTATQLAIAISVMIAVITLIIYLAA